MPATRQEAAVAIPIYKTIPNDLEVASLMQCFKVLHKHPIIFFAPQSLNTKPYQDLLKKFGEFVVERFEDKYFVNLPAYNKLLLKDTFYKRFNNFNYILIYQLDAWVFDDELSAWCQTGYDYIGAPWFSSDNPPDGLSHFMGVGNGGFSLRKIDKHLKVLRRFSYINSPSYLIPQFFKNINLKSFKTLILNLLTNNNTHHLLGKNNLNEDVFWYKMANKYNWFNVPDMLVASRFATETNCQKLYHINNRQLPFGCHAWNLYEPQFWAKYIPIASLQLPS
jgi:hypothetical protein